MSESVTVMASAMISGPTRLSTKLGVLRLLSSILLVVLPVTHCRTLRTATGSTPGSSSSWDYSDIEGGVNEGSAGIEHSLALLRVQENFVLWLNITNFGIFSSGEVIVTATSGL